MVRISSTCLSILCKTVRLSSLVLFWSNCGNGFPVCCCCCCAIFFSLSFFFSTFQIPSFYKLLLLQQQKWFPRATKTKPKKKKNHQKKKIKKISLPNPFLSFFLSLPLSLFSPSTHQEEETQTKTRTSLCPSPHGVQSFSALGKQANPNFRPIHSVAQRSTNLFVRSFVCVKETTNSERNGDCKI